MKQFLAFVRKEFLHILRDRRTILILIGMPIVQIILFGFAISTEVKDVKTVVVTHSPDADTRYVIDRIDAGEYFTVTHVVHDIREADRLFRRNEADLAVVLPDNFQRHRTEAAGIQIVADATDPNLAIMRTMYVNNVLASARMELQKTLAQPAAAAPQGHVRIEAKQLYNPQMRSAYNFVPGVMGLILMLICAIMTSVSIVREKETGTMELLLVSPIRPMLVIVSKVVPYFTLSILNLTTILLLSVFVLDVPVAGNLMALVGVSLLYILVSLSLGLLISTLTTTQVAAMLASGLVLMIPTIVISGLIFPIESMPWPLQAFSCIIPARWYIEIVRRLMIEGVPFAYVWKETLVLVAMAVLLIGIATRKFKNRLD